MSEESENKPTQAPAAPFRRRRPSRRRSGRRNDGGRGPGNFNQSGEDKPGRTDGPGILEDDESGEAERRREDAAKFVDATDETGENKSSEDRAQGDSQNGVELPREPEFGEGIIEISGKGFGFLRDAKRNFVQTPQDIFVTPELVRRFQLRDGMWVYGETRRGNRGPQLTRLLKINDDEPTKYQDLAPFEELTTINPNSRIKLETVPDRYTTRIMDLMTPLGKGQRGLIVAPPRTGKTTLLQHIADAVVKNHPEMKLIILLVDERPEEVTEIRRTVPTAELMASLQRQRHQEPHPHRTARGRACQAPGRSGQGCFHPARLDHPHRTRFQQRDRRRRTHHERRYRRSRDGNPAKTFRRRA